MIATVITPCCRIHRAHRFDLVLGARAAVTLIGVVGKVEWSASNDEVLTIADESTALATITASAVGKSTVQLLQRGRPIGELLIEVYADPTVTVNMSFGNVRDRAV